MKKDITCLYVVAILSVIANAILAFGWYTLRGKNQDLRREVSVLCGDLQDFRNAVNTRHDNECKWREFTNSLHKMEKSELDTLKTRVGDLEKRVKDLEVELSDATTNKNVTEHLEKRVSKLEAKILDQTSNRNMSEIYRALTKIKEEQFKLSNQVSSNTNYIKNLEENLEITNTFQWSAIRKLKQACPWVGLFD